MMTTDRGARELETDLERLREILRAPIVGLKDQGTHADLAGICAKLGMPEAGAGSKRERMEQAFDALLDAALPQVAERFLAFFTPSAAVRNEIQEALWALRPSPPVPKKHRRAFACAFSTDELYNDADAFLLLLERLWILDQYDLGKFFLNAPTLRARIERWVVQNPGDWSTEELFKELGAYDCSDRRFALFIEGLSSADVRLDEADQRAFVSRANAVVHACGVELRETGSEGGYPTFSLVEVAHTTRGRPKNLIFASAEKPDLRFRDAVDNDIEIVTNADKVLVYDRPIGSEGLRWRALQEWWAAKRAIEDEQEAKETLYRRLCSSIPISSPAQQLLFKSFFQTFRAEVPSLPALLPEVWLHWDPKTVEQRGASALARFRMDNLLLLPGNVRVVIEVDGKHHYTDRDGRPDPGKYASMVEADRELKLAGYEVYRFGVAELEGESGRQRAAEFFRRLFDRYGVRAG